MNATPRHLLLSLGVTLAVACGDAPVSPNLDQPAKPPGPLMAVAPAGSGLRLSASANAESNDPEHASTVSDTQGENQSGAPDPLSVSVSAESSVIPGNLLATADATATWVDANHGLLTWNVGWVAQNVPGTNGSFVLLSAIGAHDGWSYAFTADVSGTFTLQYDITVSGSNTFGMNPFNFLWHDPGSTLPLSTALAPGTSGTITYSVKVGETYRVRMTNNSGFFATGAISNRDVQMTGAFDWTIAATERAPRPLFANQCQESSSTAAAQAREFGNAARQVWLFADDLSAPELQTQLNQADQVFTELEDSYITMLQACGGSGESYLPDLQPRGTGFHVTSGSCALGECQAEIASGCIASGDPIIEDLSISEGPCPWQEENEIGDASDPGRLENCTTFQDLDIPGKDIDFDMPSGLFCVMVDPFERVDEQNESNNQMEVLVGLDEYDFLNVLSWQPWP